MKSTNRLVSVRIVGVRQSDSLDRSIYDVNSKASSGGATDDEVARRTLHEVQSSKTQERQ
jgi:hypothetical protein